MDISSNTTLSKEWWGPRIWRILHSLAEVSDRSDCMFLWKNILKLTADLLPCDACRLHFHQQIPLYHVSVSLTHNQVRDRIRDFLWSAHQGVNGRHAKVGIAREKLIDEYGVHEGYTRNDIIQKIITLVDEIVSRFTADNVLDRFHANIPILWKRAIMSLINTIHIPIMTSPPPPPSGRGGRTYPWRRV